MTPPLALSHPGPTPKRPKKPSTVPVCAACGRKLRKYGKDSRRNNELAAGSVRARTPAFLRDLTPDVGELTADGGPPMRGAYGDNVVCQQSCGHLLAVRILAALGMNILELLPTQWSHRKP